MNTPQQLCFNTDTQRVCLSLYNLNNTVSPLSTQVVYLNTPEEFAAYYAGNQNLMNSIIAPFTSTNNQNRNISPNTNTTPNTNQNNTTTNTNTNQNNTGNNQTTGRGLANFINPNFFSQ